MTCAATMEVGMRGVGKWFHEGLRRDVKRKGFSTTLD